MIQVVTKQIQDNFQLDVYHGEAQHDPITYEIKEDRIVSTLPPVEGISIVFGSLDYGPFPELKGMKSQYTFTAQQPTTTVLLERRGASSSLGIDAHSMIVSMTDCGVKVGLSASFGEEAKVPAGTHASMCLFEHGGRKIGCNEAEIKDDIAFTLIQHDLTTEPTILFVFAKIILPEEGEKGTARFGTTSVLYTPLCPQDTSVE